MGSPYLSFCASVRISACEGLWEQIQSKAQNDKHLKYRLTPQYLKEPTKVMTAMSEATSGGWREDVA